MGFFNKGEEEDKDNNKMVEVSQEDLSKTIQSVAELVQMEKEDRREINIIKDEMIEMKKEQERQGEILATEVKITAGAKSKVVREKAKLVHMLCDEHNLLYKIWGAKLHKLIQGTINYECGVSAFAEIAREDTNKALMLSAATQDNVKKYGNTLKFRSILVEARLNNGKQYDMDIKHKSYIDEVIKYHIETVGDWEDIDQETISKEAYALEMAN